MSTRTRSKDSSAPLVPARGASRPRSSSDGVELGLRGWRPGFDKVRFTQFLRDGGLPLAEAVTATGRFLSEEEITVRLRHLRDPQSASRAIAEMGVGEAP